MTVKGVAIHVIETLPDGATIDDIIHDEDARKNIQKWVK